MLPKIKIMTNPKNMSDMRVFIDGFEVEYVRSASVHVVTSEVNTVDLEIVCFIETVPWEPRPKSEV